MKPFNNIHWDGEKVTGKAAFRAASNDYFYYPLICRFDLKHLLYQTVETAVGCFQTSTQRLQIAVLSDH